MVGDAVVVTLVAWSVVCSARAAEACLLHDVDELVVGATKRSILASVATVRWFYIGARFIFFF